MAKKKGATRKHKAIKARQAAKSRPKNSVRSATKKGKGKKGKKGKGKKGLGKGMNKLGNDIADAKTIAGENFDISPLSQVDASRAPETSNHLNNLNALSDPNSAGYAGKRQGEMSDFMNRYNESTQGYDSRELNALREQRRREMDRGFQGGRAALARQQNNYRTGGTNRAAQMLELSKSYGQQSADAENDLFIQGADEKQRRLEGYGNFASTQGEQEFQRGERARDAYGREMGLTQDREFEKNKLNLGQEAASRAIESAGTYGVLGISEARKNAKKSNKLARDLAAGSGGGGGGGGNPGANPISQALNDRADELDGGQKPAEEEEEEVAA